MSNTKKCPVCDKLTSSLSPSKKSYNYNSYKDYNECILHCCKDKFREEDNNFWGCPR